MKIETFELERMQSIHENTVEYNLTESGLHPYTLDELFTDDQRAELNSMRLGYGQTNGSIPLRERISSYYEGANADNVLVTSGSAEANFLINWVLLEPEDHIAYMLPNYMQAWGINRGFGVFVHTVSLKAELGWQFALEDLRQTITRDTKAILLCNPNNPTGALIKPQMRQAIIAMAAEVEAWIVVDEIYRGAELNDEETPSFWGQYEKVIVTGGLSKAYGLPGLRLGWLVAPAAFAYHAWARSDYTTITPSILSDRAAQFALEPETRQRIFQRNRQWLRDNLKLMQNWIASHDGHLTLHSPQAGGMAFVQYDYDINSTELTDRLREDQSVLIVPGDCFGMDGYLRIGIGAEADYLQAGLNRVSEVLKGL